MRRGSTSSSRTASTKRSTMTAVLPLPALAYSRRDPSRARIASDCSWVKVLPRGPASRPVAASSPHSGSWVISRTGTPPGTGRRSPSRTMRAGPPARRPPALGHGAGVPPAAGRARPPPPARPRPARHFLGTGGGVGEHLVQLLGRQAVVALRAIREGDVIAGRAPRLLLARGRLVEARHRFRAQDVAHGEHVQGDLQATIRRPLLHRVGLRALVVDDGGAAQGIEVPPIDAPADREAFEP